MRRSDPSNRPAGPLGRVLAAAVLALGTLLTAVPPGHAADAAQPAAPRAAAAPPPASDFFATVAVEPAATVGAPAAGDNRDHGDLWPNCWSDDDNVYA